MGVRLKSTRGQSTIEWVGLITLVAALMAALTAAGIQVPAVGLAHSVSTRLLCAASLSGSCAGGGSLDEAYGPEVAELVRSGAPAPYVRKGHARPAGRLPDLPIALVRRRNRGGRGQPVHCRRAGNAFHQGHPRARRQHLHPVLGLLPRERLASRGTAPSGTRATTGMTGNQCRSGSIPTGGQRRASSHAGYNHTRSSVNWGSDLGWGFLTDAAEKVGLREKGGWGDATGRYLIAGGSPPATSPPASPTPDYPPYSVRPGQAGPAGIGRDGPLARPADFDPITPPWGRRSGPNPRPREPASRSGFRAAPMIRSSREG